MKDLMWNRLLRTRDGGDIQYIVKQCTGNTLNPSRYDLCYDGPPFFPTKNNHARFNGIQWTGNRKDWNVRCAVLMRLLEKNTVITELNLMGEEVRKTLDNWSLTSFTQKR